MENMKMLNGLTSLHNPHDQVENPSSALKTVFSAEDKYRGCWFCPFHKYHFVNQLNFLDEMDVPVHLKQ